jgi:hypothetical protein
VMTSRPARGLARPGLNFPAIRLSALT